MSLFFLFFLSRFLFCHGDSNLGKSRPPHGKNDFRCEGSLEFSPSLLKVCINFESETAGCVYSLLTTDTITLCLKNCPKLTLQLRNTGGPPIFETLCEFFPTHTSFRHLENQVYLFNLKKKKCFTAAFIAFSQPLSRVLRKIPKVLVSISNNRKSVHKI